MRAKLLVFILLLTWFFGAHTQTIERTKRQAKVVFLDSVLSKASASYINPDSLLLLGQSILNASGEDQELLRARANEMVGLSYYLKSRYKSAALGFEKAANDYRTIEDSVGMARCLNRLGLCHYHLNDFATAIEILKRALEIREKAGGNLEIASTLNNLAVCFKEVAQYKPAIEVQTKSLSLYQEENDLKGQAYSFNNLGTLYVSIEKYQEALENFSKSLMIREKLKDTLGMASTLGNIGVVHQKMGSLGVALNYLSQSAKLYHYTNDSLGLAMVYINLADALLANGKKQDAYNFLIKSQKLYDENTNQTLTLRNKKILSDYYLAIGNLHKSREVLAQYAELTEKFNNESVTKKIAELTIMFELENQEKDKRILESKLEIEQIRVQRLRIVQFFFVIIACASFFQLIYYFVMNRKIKLKNKQIEKANRELNHLNTNLESIVNSKTRELQNALKKAEESDKLKTAFLANMSHEIRTPLNGILGFARLLDDENLSPEIRKQYIDILTLRGKNLARTINDIISMSQIEAGQLEIKKANCNINKLLANLFTLFDNKELTVKKSDVKLNLVKTLSDSRCNIVTDPIRLEQILFNLIENALKNTLQGFVEFGYQLDNTRTIKFFVKDTGSGIPIDHQEKIFIRFHRFENPYLNTTSGSGLGLSICKGLVELLEGNIWFESKPNEGTTFFFTLPYIQAFTDIEPLHSSKYISPQNVDFSGKVILVVEDDLISFQLIEAILRDTNAKLIHVKNGEDAIEVCQITKNIDLVLMDMRLPFLNGYEATSRIKRINPKLTIVAQTANVLSDDRDKCIGVGCSDYIAKPIDPDEFLRTIANNLLCTEA